MLGLSCVQKLNPFSHFSIPKDEEEHFSERVFIKESLKYIKTKKNANCSIEHVPS